MKVPVTKLVQKSSRKTEKVPVTILENEVGKKQKCPWEFIQKIFKKLAKTAENTFSTLKFVKITLFVI